MRSLNRTWSSDGFHTLVAELATTKKGDRVLDVGCGRGHGLLPLLARVGVEGTVIGADRDQRSLAAAQDMHQDDIAAGRLVLSVLDLARPLPFASASFDVIVCQNVIECVFDKANFIRELHRLLNPAGHILMGHHDFDGVLIASDDRNLTRRLVHGYADYTQPWQDASDGQMGRLLPGLMKPDLFEAETETVLFVDLALTTQSYARIHLDGIVALSQEFGVSSDQAEAWLRKLTVRSQEGTFYYALPWTYVLARRLPLECSE